MPIQLNPVATGEDAVAESRSPVGRARWLLRPEALLGIGCLVALAGYQFWRHLMQAIAKPLSFDDAFMFYRYALHIRSGIGIAWNPDGLPTYGLTSPAWCGVVLLFSFLPVAPSIALVLASWLSAVVGLCSITWAVVRTSTSRIMRSPLVVLAMVSVPLLHNHAFVHLTTTGMDTMASLAANALLAWAVLRFARQQTNSWAVAGGVVAFLTFFTRPDNGACALMIPVLAWWATGRNRQFRPILIFSTTTITLIAAELLACRWYFGTALPLSFYMKSGIAYAGYASFWNPVAFLLMAIGMVWVFIAIAVLAVRAEHARLLLAFLVPVSLTFVYSLTVNQIMGFSGRYYVPFLPFIVVPVLHSLDSVVLAGRQSRPKLRIALLVLIMVVVWQSTAIGVPVSLAYRRFVGEPRTVAQPRLVVRAQEPLPRFSWFTCVKSVGHLVSNLPAGATVSASEVGYMGAVAPQVAIVDLVGLNDPDIALRGFSSAYVLNRRPDLIWFPHTDYTGMRAQMFSDPRLLREYKIIDGAFNYGVAIRRGSPFEREIMKSTRDTFQQLYPGRDLEDYVVERVE